MDYSSRRGLRAAKVFHVRWMTLAARIREVGAANIDPVYSWVPGSIQDATLTREYWADGAARVIHLRWVTLAAKALGRLKSSI